MNTLSAHEIRMCLDTLAEADRWLTRTRHGLNPANAVRVDIITESISYVRGALLHASLADVAVEPTEP